MRSLSNYIKGRGGEYEVRDILLAAGYPLVVRSAGSHGLFDLVAINSVPIAVRYRGRKVVIPNVLLCSVKLYVDRKEPLPAHIREVEAFKDYPAGTGKSIWWRRARSKWKFKLWPAGKVR